MVKDYIDEIVKDILDNFSSEKGSKIADNYIKKLNETYKFFETDEFNQLIDIIEKYKLIDQNALLYETTNIDGLTGKDFGRVCNTIYSRLESEAKRDNTSSFEKYHIDYKDIRFHLMIGQGSNFWTTKEI